MLTRSNSAPDRQASDPIFSRRALGASSPCYENVPPLSRPPTGTLHGFSSEATEACFWLNPQCLFVLGAGHVTRWDSGAGTITKANYPSTIGKIRSTLFPADGEDSALLLCSDTEDSTALLLVELCTRSLATKILASVSSPDYFPYAATLCCDSEGQTVIIAGSASVPLVQTWLYSSALVPSASYGFSVHGLPSVWELETASGHSSSFVSLSEDAGSAVVWRFTAPGLATVLFSANVGARVPVTVALSRDVLAISPWYRLDPPLKIFSVPDGRQIASLSLEAVGKTITALSLDESSSLVAVSQGGNIFIHKVREGLPLAATIPLVQADEQDEPTTIYCRFSPVHSASLATGWSKGYPREHFVQVSDWCGNLSARLASAFYDLSIDVTPDFEWQEMFRDLSHRIKIKATRT
jgi:hypothetical protein